MEEDRLTWVDLGLYALFALLLTALALQRSGFSPRAQLRAALDWMSPARPAAPRAPLTQERRSSSLAATNFEAAFERSAQHSGRKEWQLALEVVNQALHIDSALLPAGSRERALKARAYYQMQLGMALYHQADYRGALGHLRDYVDSGEQLPAVGYHMILCAYDRSGDAEQAFQWIHRGLAVHPNDPWMNQIAPRFAKHARAEASMTRHFTEHFIVQYPDVPGTEPLLRRVTEALERAYERVQPELGSLSGHQALVVFYPSKASYQSVSNTPHWAGGSYDGVKIRIPLPAGTPPPGSLERTIAHELTRHAVFRLVRGKAPAWLNEGLAQLLDGADKSRVVQRLARTRSRFRLADLESCFGRIDNVDQAHLAYAQAYEATARLVGQVGMARIRQGLAALREGQSLTEALPEAAAMR